MADPKLSVASRDPYLFTSLYFEAITSHVSERVTQTPRVTEECVTLASNLAEFRRRLAESSLTMNAHFKRFLEVALDFVISNASASNPIDVSETSWSFSLTVQADLAGLRKLCAAVPNQEALVVGSALSANAGMVAAAIALDLFSHGLKPYLDSMQNGISTIAEAVSAGIFPRALLRYVPDHYHSTVFSAMGESFVGEPVTAQGAAVWLAVGEGISPVASLALYRAYYHRRYAPYAGLVRLVRAAGPRQLVTLMVRKFGVPIATMREICNIASGALLNWEGCTLGLGYLFRQFNEQSRHWFMRMFHRLRFDRDPAILAKILADVVAVKYPRPVEYRRGFVDLKVAGADLTAGEGFDTPLCDDLYLASVVTITGILSMEDDGSFFRASAKLARCSAKTWRWVHGEAIDASNREVWRSWLQRLSRTP